MVDNVTFIIKTLERFECVKRLVKSIYKRYPDAKVLVGDDSKQSCKEYLEKKYSNKDLKVFELPYDCGLSYGRNYLMNKVETEYFCLLDDDFVFDNKVDIEYAVDLLREKNIDILGGYFRNYRKVKSVIDRDRLKLFIDIITNNYEKLNYIGQLEYDDKECILSVKARPNDFPDFCMSDFVHNFFVAKTDIREKVSWDDELKILEHEAFFYNVKNRGLKVGFTNRLNVQHRPITSLKYTSFRSRNYYKVFMDKYGIKKMIFYKDGIISAEYDA